MWRLPPDKRERWSRWLNASAAVVWAACIPTGMYIGWTESIPFLFIASVYANFVGHVSALEASISDPEVLRLLALILDRMGELETRGSGGRQTYAGIRTSRRKRTTRH